MTKYENGVPSLLKYMIKELVVDKETVLSKKSVIDWFTLKYPKIGKSTVECQLTRVSTNAPSRLHYHAVPGEDDILFKIDSRHFRLFDPQRDPEPICSKTKLDAAKKSTKRRQKDYQSQIIRLVDNCDELHNAFYEKNVFTGPSLYFHNKAIDARVQPDNERYLEYIYATLVSWGMHRMGAGGSKMLPFSEFKQSVDRLSDEIRDAQKIDFKSITESDWSLLEKIFKNLRIMKTGTSLVGNSKAMAHLMPNIVPPIDRAYTLSYLNESVKNGHETEWRLMRNIIEGLFIPVAKDKTFAAKAKKWIEDGAKYPWDTSIFKLIDNLIIAVGYRKTKKKKKAQ